MTYDSSLVDPAERFANEFVAGTKGAVLNLWMNQRATGIHPIAPANPPRGPDRLELARPTPTKRERRAALSPLAPMSRRRGSQSKDVHASSVKGSLRYVRRP